MNDRFDRQDLIERLMMQGVLGKAEADAFVETFFTLVRQVLDHEKYLKINGLGTFRLTEDGIGPHVHTDEGNERSVQKGRVVVFTPDASLKDAVNKPFAQFETVLLKEGVRFDDVPEVTVPAEEAERPECASEKEEKPVQVSAPAKPEDSPHPAKASSARLPWYAVLCILLVGMLLGVGLAWMFVSRRQAVLEPSADAFFKRETADSVAAKDSYEADAASIPVPDSAQGQVVIPALSQHQKVETPAQSPAASKRKVLADTVSYDIVGTQAVHTLRPGESLARIALKLYGNKRLWPYLVRHNRAIIRNPDNIPIGTKIRVPILSPRK